MKAKLTLMSVLFIFALTQISFGNGLSLNSIGPKSLGMGGAFVGVADDYTAMYWNPAGITQLNKMQVGLFVTDIIPASTYTLDMGVAKIDASTKSNHYISPNLMGYIPLMNGDLTVGLGVFVPAGLGAEWEGEDLKLLSGNKAFEWMSKIAVFNISPGAAYKFNDMLSVGVAANIYYGMFDIKQPRAVSGTVIQYSEESTGMGYGISAGVLVKPIDMISLGLSFKTKTTIAFSGTAKNPGLAAFNAEETDFDRDVDWPMWFGAGVAVRPIDGLTLAFDAQYSQWSKSQEVLNTDYKDWHQFMEPDEMALYLYWVDCWQIRFGANYEVSPDLQVRAGFYHDPAPAPDETLNILFPSNTYETITVGASYALCPSMGIDFGFEYLMGDDRDIPMTYVKEHPHAVFMPGVHHTDIIAVSLGFCYTIQ